MFESGYLVPMAAEWLASPAPKRTLLGSILYRQLHSSNTSTFTVAWNQIQNSGLSFLINGICILSLAIILISLGPLIQIVLSSSQCGLRKRKSLNPRRRQITVFLLGFICCWLLLGTFLVASVIFLSENLGFAHPQSSSFVSRVDDVSNRTFTLLRVLANESLSLVDDAVNGLVGDVYMSILTEVPTITTQFLNHTDLNTPLAMLGDLARTVESLLSAHIHLRENGPQVASELGKLDSNIRVNGDMLLNEFKQVWKECGEVESHIPSLKPFGEAITQLSTGLYDNQSEFVPFFQLFRLESSLGLFNMLNVLPFNVSEVTAQLKSAIKVRTELEESIKNKTVIWFRGLSDQPDKVAGFLAPYVDNVVANINTTDKLYHQNMEVVKSFIYRLERMWIIIYFIGLMVLATPTVLLLSSCLRPRHSVMHPVKKVSPLLTPSEADSVVSSGRGSSDDEVSSVVSAPPTRKRHAFSGAYSELKSLDCPTVHELLVKPEKRRSLSLDSDSGCPRNDSRLEKETPGSWSRTETFDSLNVGTSNRFRDGCCAIGDSKYRRCKTCAHLVSCCGLLLLALVCIPLLLSIGYFHIQVCLPLAPNKPQQVQLDQEINSIIDNNWENWMQLIGDSVLQYVRSSDPSESTNFNLRNHLNVTKPRNLVSSLFNRCSTPAGNKSFFNVIDFSLQLNLTGILQIPLVKRYSDEFKVTFAEKAVALMTEKLDAGLLPPNFELLLQSLKAEPVPETTADASGASVLETADRFWSQSINGAPERELSINASLANLQKIRLLQRQLASFRRSLEHEIASVTLLPRTCSIRLSQMLQISRYSLRLIKSARRSFPFRQRVESLSESAQVLHRISRQPSFTKTLSTFADLAYDMGLSKTSPNASRVNLIRKVENVIGLEYERLAAMFEGGLAAKFINARIASLLDRFTAPCSRFGVIAENVVGTTCVTTGVSRPPDEFVPILQRISAVGLTLLIVITVCPIHFVIYVCIIQYLSRQRCA